MNYRFWQEIIANEIPCVFVSPHLGDASFACGGLILHLSEFVPVNVVTLFTEGDEASGGVAISDLFRKTGLNSSTKLFSALAEEDFAAFESKGIISHHFGFKRAEFRQVNKPGFLRRKLGVVFKDFLNLYPTKEMHLRSGVIAPQDLSLTFEIYEKLNKFLGQFEKCVVFCPLATGRHVDHVITRTVCSNLGLEILFYDGAPFINRFRPDEFFIKAKQLKRTEFPAYVDQKKKLLEGYPTRLLLVREKVRIAELPERYYGEFEL